MTVLPGVLGCRTLRRTVQVSLGSNPLAVARWHSLLHGLATAIRETSGLVYMLFDQHSKKNIIHLC
ncbi:MAG: hypothetical protein V3U56_14385 [Syntrophobacteria bacterium]